MAELFYDFISNMTIFRVGTYLSPVIDIIFLVMVLRKRNRDERGLKILGKASIITLIYLLVVGNLIAQFITSSTEVGFLQYGNTVQWLYNSVLIVEIIAVFIIRKIE